MKFEFIWMAPFISSMEHTEQDVVESPIARAQHSSNISLPLGQA